MKRLFIVAVLLLIIPVTTACAEEDYRYYYNDLYESSGAEELEDALPDDARSLMDELGFDMLSGDLSSKGMLQLSLIHISEPTRP